MGSASGSWRLAARPRAAPGGPLSPGVLPLGLDPARDALVHVPEAAAGGEPRPLAVMLHGAGSNAGRGLAPLLGPATDRAIVLLAPDSRGASWDVIHGGFGPDVELLDRALDRVFSICPIDPVRVALGGFSDGASYALSLGLGNGDLFTHLLAFSPGFAAPGGAAGVPRIFVSHGTRDRVLPVDRCSRRLVPVLREAGYDVVYEEFDGGHVVPEATARRAVDWFLA